MSEDGWSWVDEVDITVDPKDFDEIWINIYPSNVPSRHYILRNGAWMPSSEGNNKLLS